MVNTRSKSVEHAGLLSDIINNDLKTLGTVEEILSSIKSTDPNINLLKSAVSVMCAQLIDTRTKVLTLVEDTKSIDSELRANVVETAKNECSILVAIISQ